MEENEDENREVKEEGQKIKIKQNDTEAGEDELGLVERRTRKR